MVNPAPRQAHIGVVSFLFGDLPGAVYEIESGAKVGEGKASFQVMPTHDAPSRDLRFKPLQFFPSERRHSAAARNAVLLFQTHTPKLVQITDLHKIGRTVRYTCGEGWQPTGG
jgi:hypothetical protein